MATTSGVRRRGKSWTAYWWIDGIQHSKGGFTTQREAKDYRLKALNSLATGTYVGPDKQTLGSVFDDWIAGASARIRPTTVDGYRRLFNRYARKPLGSVRLQALTALDLDGLYGELLNVGGRGGGPISPTTVNHLHALIHKLLADATRKGLVARNVADAASPPKQLRPGERVLTVWFTDQLARFLRAVESDRLQALWRIYCLTGCRRGEALAARWDDIDLDRGRWEIRQALGVLNGSPVLGLPKSGRGRVVDLDAGTISALKAHRKAQLEERLAAASAYQDAGLVFCHEDGTALHPNSVSRVFVRLSAVADLPRIRLHDVRHSAVTALLRAGVDVKVVSERVGHASTSFTRDVYQSVLPGMQAEAAARIAALLDG